MDKSKKVCIMGVPRSGTTAVYSILQKIMDHHFKKKVSYVYEPLLWNPADFNDEYRKVSQNFNSMGSISHEGIMAHLSLPLFISDPKGYKSPYLENLLGSGFNTLSKFVRANGRFKLLQKISPETRFIFIIRNPADTIHSIKNQFSFFGGEFHRDDSDRFRREIEPLYPKGSQYHLSPDRYNNDYLYWHHMNRFALESFKNVSHPPMILCHEQFTTDKEKTVTKLCEFLDIPFRKRYVLQAKKKVGAITTRREINESDFRTYERITEDYIEMLEELKLSGFIQKSQILGKYTITDDPPKPVNRYYGLNPITMVQRFEEHLQETEKNYLKKLSRLTKSEK